MTRIQTRVLAIGLVVMIAIGVALFGGLIPGLRPDYGGPATTFLNGHEYYVDAPVLNYPALGTSNSSMNVTFHNVTFALHLTNWYSVVGGIIHGNGTESNGTRYAFELGELLPNGTRPTLYVSPDSVFVGEWNGGWLGSPTIDLLVETSYVGTGNGLT